MATGSPAGAGTLPCLDELNLSRAWLAELARLLPELLDPLPGLTMASVTADNAALQRLHEATACWQRCWTSASP